jgi:hypothetical protein
MSYYAHKKFLIRVHIAESDGFLETAKGIEVVKAGDKIGTNEIGDQFVIPNEYFNKYYEEVEKVEPKFRKKSKSPFELEYEKSLVEFGSLPNPFEDDEYINGTYELSKNK